MQVLPKLRPNTGREQTGSSRRDGSQHKQADEYAAILTNFQRSGARKGLSNGGPNHSIPYFAMTRFITWSLAALSIFAISLPSSSKNFSNPPGWHTRISFPSSVPTFAQTWGMSRGSQ